MPILAHGLDFRHVVGLGLARPSLALGAEKEGQELVPRVALSSLAFLNAMVFV